MPSHFSDIGFEFPTVQELDDFMMEYLSEDAIVQGKKGRFAYIPVPPSIEYWLPLEPESNTVLDYEFHFRTENYNPVYLAEGIELDGFGLSGLIRAGVLLKEADDEGGIEAPINLTVPALGMIGEWERTFADAQIACFAESLAFYPDEESYLKLGCGWAPEHFVPSGTFSPKGRDPDFVQSSHVILGGRILEVNLCTNGYSGLSFYHIPIQCMGLLLDVLAAPEFFEEEPEAGGILSGSFWVTAMLRERKKDD